MEAALKEKLMWLDKVEVKKERRVVSEFGIAKIEVSMLLSEKIFLSMATAAIFVLGKKSLALVMRSAIKEREALVIEKWRLSMT